MLYALLTTDRVLAASARTFVETERSVLIVAESAPQLDSLVGTLLPHHLLVDLRHPAAGSVLTRTWDERVHVHAVADQLRARTLLKALIAAST